MNKEMIAEYLREIKGLLLDGRTVRAWQRLDFLSEEVNNDVMRGDSE